MAPQGGAVEPRIRFWSDELLWPDDSPTHVFLARVTHYVGRMFWGAAWTGSEPTVELVAPLPNFYDTQVDHQEILRACHLLFEHDSAFKNRCPDYAVYLDKWPMPTEEEWSRACVISQRLSDERRQVFNRFFQLCSHLSSAFKDGTIMTATRGFDGGPEIVQDRSFWNTENYWPRFCTCQIDPQEPYRRTIVPTGGAYIFVERISLEKALRLKPAEDVLEGGVDEYLSPYLRCMIEVSRALGITPTHQPKIDFLKAEIPRFWHGVPPLTGQDISRMATLLREPDSKSGRGNRVKKP